VLLVELANAGGRETAKIKLFGVELIIAAMGKTPLFCFNS